MLRPAEVTDATAILQTRIAAIRELASPHYPQAEIDEWCSSRTAETYHAPIERKAVLVYEVGGKVVAFGQLNPGAALVEAVYVSPAYSRRGIGLQVLRALEAMAAQHGVPALTLEASFNVVEFYRRAGYVPVSESENAVSQRVVAASVVMRHEILAPTAA